MQPCLTSRPRFIYILPVHPVDQSLTGGSYHSLSRGPASNISDEDFTSQAGKSQVSLSVNRYVYNVGRPYSHSVSIRNSAAEVSPRLVSVLRGRPINSGAQVSDVVVLNNRY